MIRRTFFALSLLLFALASCQNAEDNTVKAADILKKLAKGETVVYSGKKITGVLDFTKAGRAKAVHLNLARTRIAGGVTFHECTFEDSVIAFRQDPLGGYATSFGQNLSFLKCQLKQGLDLSSSQVGGDFNFVESICYGPLKVNTALLEGKRNSLSYSKFIGKVQINNSLVIGDLRVMEAEFRDKLSARRSDFRGDLVFGRCLFPQGADMTANRFRDRFRLVFGQMGNQTTLQHSVFGGEVDISGTKSDSLFVLSHNTFNALPVQKNLETKIFQSENNKLLIYTPLDSLIQPVKTIPQ